MILRLLLLALVIPCLGGCGEDPVDGWPDGAGEERPLRLVVVQPADKVSLAEVARVHEPLLLELGKATGLRFHPPTVVRSPVEAREMLGRGEADFGLLGAFTLGDALADEQVHWIARCIKEPATADIELVLLVEDASRFREIADLGGRTIGLVSLQDRAAEAEPFLLIPDDLLENEKTRFRVFRLEVPTLVAVAEGEVDAAVIERTTWDRVVADRLFRSTPFRAIATRPVPVGGAVVGARSLPAPLREKLASAFAVLGDEEGIGDDVLLGPMQTAVDSYRAGPVEARAHEQVASELRAALARRAEALSPYRGVPPR